MGMADISWKMESVTCRSQKLNQALNVSDHPEGNYVNASIGTATEPAMGVVSASLPGLRPLSGRQPSWTDTEDHNTRQFSQSIVPG